jgi:hypothetical protein
MYKYNISPDSDLPIYGISQNDSLAEEEKELFSQMAKFLRYNLNYRNEYNPGDIFTYLRNYEGAVFIDPLNHLKLCDNDGGIDLIGRNGSFLQGANFKDTEAVYRGQEGVPLEYKLAVNHQLRHDMDRPYLFCSLKPEYLSHDRVELKNIIDQTLINGLDINPEDLKHSSVRKRRKREEILHDVDSSNTEFGIYTRSKQQQSIRAGKLNPLETNFAQSIPYLLTSKHQDSGKDTGKDKIATKMASYVHKAIKGTPIEDYLKLWKGNVLINLNNSVDDFPKIEDYRPFEIALIGNNRSFYQGGVYGRHEYYYSANYRCDAAEYVPFRLEKTLDLRIGYPKSQACLYVGVHPDFFIEKNITEKDQSKTNIEKYISQFAHSIYLSTNDMDVESYVFGQNQGNKTQSKVLDLSITKNAHSPRYQNLRHALPPKEVLPTITVCIGMAEVRPMLQNNDLVPKVVVPYRYHLDDYFKHNKTTYYYARTKFIKAFINEAKLMGTSITNKEAAGAADLFDAQSNIETTSEDLRKLEDEAFGPKPAYEDKYKL